PRLVAARSLDDADDIASVLHARVARATARPAGSGRTRKAPRLIVGLIPHAGGQMADDMRRALDERRELIEGRADAVLRGYLTDEEPWTADLGAAPRGDKQKAAWWRAARTVAAYRDRYGITDDRTPLGPTPESTSQKIDAIRARAALNRAQAIAHEGTTADAVRPATTSRPAPSL
ncbi:MAG: MobF family relaxase, partial [Georgenia sp.]